MIRIPLMILTLALWSLPADAQASIVIFKKELKFNTDVNNFVTNQATFDLVFVDNPLNPGSTVKLYDDLVLTPTNVGDEFEKTDSDPAFAMAVSLLQDGLDEHIQYILTEGPPGGGVEKRGGPESNFFSIGNPPNAPLLDEATIDKFLLRVDTFPFFVGNPVTAGLGAPLEVILELTIYGTIEIPEPSTGWLLILGTGTLGSVHFRRRRRTRLA